MNIVEDVENRIKKQFGENINIDFKDEKGDGKHFILFIVSEQFEGKSRIERSQEVYKILDDLLKTDSIHALRMRLETPNEIK